MAATAEKSAQESKKVVPLGSQVYRPIASRKSCAELSAWQMAWDWIFDHWETPDWKPLPAWIRTIISIHSSIGMYGGMLVTAHSVRGIREFLERMNRPLK